MNKINSRNRHQSWPIYADDEVQAVCRVLESGQVNYWTGSEGRLFEEEFSRYCGVSHAVALANGTVALELALRVLGVGAGDEVVVTPRTFIASVSAIVMVGATPVFADVDKTSQNITAETIRPVISEKTRAVVTVHLAGWPCDMDPIMDLAEENGLSVIEDCAQAHGASYKGKKVGSLGHIAAFSFCQDKIISTGGEGGMLVTNHHELWKRAWAFKDHGKSWEATHQTKHSPSFRWLHESIGTNWRMTELQAAIGRIQLHKLPGWLEQRKNSATRLNEGLSELTALRLPSAPEEVGHAYYKYYLFVDEGKWNPGWNHVRLIEEINQQGVFCQSGSCSAVYREKAFVDQQTGINPFAELSLPVADELGRTGLMFQVDPTVTSDDLDKLVQVVKAVCARALKV